MVKVVRFRRCFFLWLSSSDSFPSLSGESGHMEASPVLLPQHTPAERRRRKVAIVRLNAINFRKLYFFLSGYFSLSLKSCLDFFPLIIN